MSDLLSDVLEWDVENWSRAIRFWERSVDLSRPNLRCLEVGAHHGGLSLWLALKGCSVVCSDLENTEQRASPLHERYGVRGAVTYRDIDAVEIPYENEFDIVTFKSVLGGIAWDGDIERQRKAMASMYRALRPGGTLLFAENLRGSAMHRMLRQRLTTWYDVWRYVAVDEMLQFLKPYTGVRYETTGFVGLLGRRPAAYQFLGRLDGALFDRIVPADARYIMYGVARKPLTDASP